MPTPAPRILGPSNRSFGLVFAGVFLIAGTLPLWRGGEPRNWALVASGLFGTLALVRPALLAPANRIWFRIGLAMHRIVNPVVMALLFYVVVTPFGLLWRAVNRDVTRQLRPDPSAPTYWRTRTTGSSTMEQQF